MEVFSIWRRATTRRRVKGLRALFPALTLAAGVAGAAETPAAGGSPPPSPAAPPYRLMRQDEDYRHLEGVDRSQLGWADAIKQLPLGASDWRLTFGGEIRVRYEYFDNAQWGAGPQDEDGFLLQRTMLHADLWKDDWLRLFTQFKSGLEEGREGGPRPPDRDDLDVHQLFLEARADVFGPRALSVRLGRQELHYGSGRLVTVREAPNVRQSFDGAKVVVKRDGWQLDLFATRPVQTKRYVFDDGPEHREALWGAYWVAPLPGRSGIQLDLYYLGLEREEARFNQGPGWEVRHSLGSRVWGRRAAFDYNFEFIYQVGTFGPGDIQAWTVASEAGYSLPDLPWSPRLALKANVTSGDRDLTDPDLETFNPMFPKGGYFSEMGLIGPANHVDVHPVLELKPARGVLWTTDWDVFWRQSEDDGIYGNAVNLVRPSRGSDDLFVGHHVQTMVEWRWGRHLTLAAVYAHFFAGGFLADTGPAEDVDYVSAWATWKF